MRERAAPGLLFGRRREVHAVLPQGFVCCIDIIDAQRNAHETSDQRFAFFVAGSDALHAKARPANLGPFAGRIQ